MELLRKAKAHPLEATEWVLFLGSLLVGTIGYEDRLHLLFSRLLMILGALPSHFLHTSVRATRRVTVHRVAYTKRENGGIPISPSFSLCGQFVVTGLEWNRENEQTIS